MMSNNPAAPHGPPIGPGQSDRRQNGYPYPPHVQYPPPHPGYYPAYHQPPYLGPQIPHYPQQWYQPYPHYAPQAPRPFQHHSNAAAPSIHQNSQAIPFARQQVPPPHTPQPPRTPQPSQDMPSASSTGSQPVASVSTTPTTTTLSTFTPPAIPKASADSGMLSQSSRNTPFYPQLPWLSVQDSILPPRAPRRRRRRPAELTSEQPELPSKAQPHFIESDLDSHQLPSSTSPNFAPVEAGKPAATTESIPVSTPSPRTDAPTVKIDPIDPPQQSPESPAPSPQPPNSHRRTATKLVIPALPFIPIGHNRSRSNITSPNTALPATESSPTNKAEFAPVKPSEDTMGTSESAAAISEQTTSSSDQPLKAPPKSWAALFNNKSAAVDGATFAQGTSTSNGTSLPKTGTLGEVLRLYSVQTPEMLSFLEPRGLVNTGNMCYMNSILQILVFCVPFYDFLYQIGKRAVHNFKSDTPLVEAMIMFMREYPSIVSADSVSHLRAQLKDADLERYGDSFIPEYVYDVIKKLPRFATMRRGHQQDAEEFLGFLLEGLHDECVVVMKKSDEIPPPLTNGTTSPTSERPGGVSGDAGWLEVGPKQKAAVTRSSGTISTESPITKIFGGKLRSVFKVPGLKDSVTLEPYQPLQLDIGSPSVNNITDALRGLTRSETLNGDFNSPRGPGTPATKQVFIESLPPVLILHLKRFQYDNTGGTQKIWKKVGYPLELEIPKEVFSRTNQAARASPAPKYQLIGVVYHHGKNASGGHYTVDVRRQDGQEWIRLDDTVIRRVRSEDVAKEGGEEDPKILAKALEQHKKDTDAGKTIYETAGFEDGDNGEDDDENAGGWSQVNGHATSPTSSGKKWSAVTNGESTPSTAGKRTPRDAFSMKDNKVAYILFYKRIAS